MKNKRQYKGVSVTDYQWEVIHLWQHYQNPRSLAVVMGSTEGAVISAITYLENKGIKFAQATVDVQLNTGLFMGSKIEPYYANEADVFRSLLPKYEYNKALEAERPR